MKLSLIRDHGVDENGFTDELRKWAGKYCINFPCRVIFTDADRMLYFIAARHTHNRQSATFKLIRQAFEKYDFDLLIIEGVDYKLGLNPKGYFHHIDTDRGKTNEIRYTTEQARKRGIDVIGAEPDWTAQFDALIEHGYSRQDTIAFEYLRLAIQHHRQGLSRAQHDRTMKKWGIEIDIDRWLKKWEGEKLNYARLNNNYTAPVQTGTRVQQMSYQNDLFREKIVVKHIYELSKKKYRKILTVYGANHLYAQFEVWKDEYARIRRK